VRRGALLDERGLRVTHEFFGFRLFEARAQPGMLRRVAVILCGAAFGVWAAAGGASGTGAGAWPVDGAVGMASVAANRLPPANGSSQQIT